MSEPENRDRRRAGGNGKKVEGGREGGQPSTASTGLPTSEGEQDQLRKPPSAAVPAPPDLEVPAKAVRWPFSANYKLRILEQVRACSERGQVGQLLQRDGLNSSHLTARRKAL